MAIPWAQAVQVGCVGFGTVFALLVILAVVIWLVGLITTRTSKQKSDNSEKGA